MFGGGNGAQNSAQGPGTGLALSNSGNQGGNTAPAASGNVAQANAATGSQIKKQQLPMHLSDYGDEDVSQRIEAPEANNPHPVYAVAPGRVIREGWQKKEHHGSHAGLGYRISIGGSKGYWQYGHMDPETITVRVGDTVTKGELLGDYADPTNGNSTGPHTHLEYRLWSNPRQTVYPGGVSPLGPTGVITSGWHATGGPHSLPHQGIDWAYPPG